jgi:outer membrane protein OmpA-like peptidoglycan-associated protein
MKNIIFLFIFLNGTFCLAQPEVPQYKGFKDTSFEVADIILAPEIRFSLSGNRAVLPQYHDSVKVIADFLIKNPGITVEIGVHSDIRGNAEMNLKLSEMGAESIKDLLVDMYKISYYRIKTKGYGESEPLMPENIIAEATSREKKDELHALNRRVVVKILKIDIVH